MRLRLPSVTGKVAISLRGLPAKFSGVMQGAWMGTSNIFLGVRVIMLNTCLYA